MKRRAAAKLPPAADGLTLLDYLSGRFDYHSREEWQKRIAGGELALNGVTVSDPQQLLQCGDHLEYTPQDLVEPPVNCNYRIVYEDDVLLVIDKPGNLPVHPAGPYFAHTLWALLQDAGYGALHLVNRLDRETSGLLIAGKNSQAAGKIAKTLPDMQKIYYTAVHGNFPNELLAEGFLAKDPESAIRKKQRFTPYMPDDENAKSARTFFRRLQYAPQKDLSLISAELFTGRMHQIRATLRSLDHPVVGDKLYGLNEQFYRRLALDTLSAEDRQMLILDHQALHCACLTIQHPLSDQTMHFESPLPEEIAGLFTPTQTF